MMTNPHGVLLTVAQVAELASCAESTVRRALAEGRLAGVKFGSAWLIERSALETWQPRAYVRAEERRTAQ